MPFIGGLIIGLIVGAIVGLLVAGLCVAAREGDRMAKQMYEGMKQTSEDL